MPCCSDNVRSKVNIFLVVLVVLQQLLHVYFIGYVLTKCMKECDDFHKLGVVLTGLFTMLLTVIYLIINDKPIFGVTFTVLRMLVSTNFSKLHGKEIAERLLIFVLIFLYVVWLIYTAEFTYDQIQTKIYPVPNEFNIVLDS